MTQPRKTADPSKSKFYLGVDLFAKVTSSLALVALGVAGWLLQSKTEESRQAADRFEKQERRYLPMLRSLSELELELENVALAMHSIETQSPATAEEQEYELGKKLRYVAGSVIVPDGDPMVSLRLPDAPAAKERLSMPLRATAVMYAEILRIRRFLSNQVNDFAVQLDPDRQPFVVLVEPSGDISARLNVAPDSIPAWKTWLDARTVRFSMIRNLPMKVLADDLRFATSDVVHQTLLKHVDLGDRYVEIRSNLLKSRDVVRPPADSSRVK